MAESSGYKCSFQKLNGENYAVWSYKMELLLIDDNVWDVIDKEKPTGDDKVAVWNKGNDKARVRIGLSVEDDQLIHIRSATTAKDAWKALKEYHQKATLTSKVLLLKRLCRTVLGEDGDMEAHITNFSNTVNQLIALGTDLADDLLAAMLLGSLPESYDTLVTALESRPEKDITSQFIKSKLIDEYKRRKGQKDVRDNFPVSETAMKATFKDNSGQNGSVVKSCFFCKKIGHVKQECKKYAAWKTKNSNKAKAAKEKVTPNEEKLFMAKANVLLTEQPAENIEYARFSVKAAKDYSDTWFVDSGATSHMTNSKEFFHEFDPAVKGVVRLADAEKTSAIKGRGSGVIKCIVDGKQTTEN